MLPRTSSQSMLMTNLSPARSVERCIILLNTPPWCLFWTPGMQLTARWSVGRVDPPSRLLAGGNLTERGGLGSWILIRSKKYFVAFVQVGGDDSCGDHISAIPFHASRCVSNLAFDLITDSASVGQFYRVLSPHSCVGVRGCHNTDEVERSRLPLHMFRRSLKDRHYKREILDERR